MPGQRCQICHTIQKKDSGVAFHRFPRDPVLRRSWLEVFQLGESDLKPSSRVCSRHFPDGDSKKMPSTSVGEYKLPCLAMSRNLKY